LKIKHLFISIALSAIAVLALTWVLSAATPASRAASYTVCPAGPPTCDYAIIQDAVDAAGEGDIIKVATGAYTDVNNYGGLAQVVYISKTVTLRGGYAAPGFADPPDPEANPTTLDAQGLGRVLYITGNISPTVEGLRITGGDAAGLGGGHGGWDAGGGGYVISATATIKNNRVFGNTANSGGGLFLRYSNNTLTRNTILSNTAEYGGGCYLSYSDAPLVDNAITFNVANWNGGGLWLFNSDAKLNGNTILSNTASWDGGGLWLDSSDGASLGGNTISSNTAKRGGGLYLVFSDAALSSNTVNDNNAEWGGGGLYLRYSNAILDRNTVTTNHAASQGGGLYLVDSDATINRNTIASNAADMNGGGLYVGWSDNVMLNGNTIFSNTANRNGGGLYLCMSSAPKLTNNIVVNNEANTSGSGLYIHSSSLQLLHTTVADNSSGDGSGIHIAEWGQHNYITLTNTILVSHTVGITVAAGNTATLEATLWGSGAWANDTDWGGDGTIITGTINLWDNPVFVNPGAGDYHIGPDSAAIDAGVDAGVTVDIDGEPRPSDAGYDIGADEYWPAGAFKFVYLPLVVR